MENLKGFATLLIVALILSLPAACSGSQGTVKVKELEALDHSTPVTQVNSADKFLFKYFGLQDLATPLKALPKQVQYLISVQLRDHYLVPFVLKDPIAHYTAHIEEDLPGFVESVHFSPDDSHIVIKKTFSCRSGELMLKEGSPNPSAIKLEHLIPPTTRYHFMVAFNDDFSKMALLRNPNDSQAHLSEFDISKECRVIGSERPLGEVAKLLQDESLQLPANPVVFKGLQCHEVANRIAAICYTPANELVFATSYKQMYVLGKDGSLKKIEDKKNVFNPKELVLKYRDKTKTTLTKDLCRGYRALIEPSTANALFRADNDLIMCNYTAETFETLREKSPNCQALDAIAAHGQIALLSSDYSDKTVFLVDLTTRLMTSIVLPDGIGSRSTCLSPDRMFLFVSKGLVTLIYYVPAATIIGYIDQAASLNAREITQGDAQRTTSFNRSGNYFATYKSFNLKKTPDDPTTVDMEVLAIWRMNPDWYRLEDLYKAHITIEQALFLIFLRKISYEKKSLQNVAEDAGIAYADLISELKRVRDSFTLDQRALRSYIRFDLTREPRPKAK